MGMSRMVTCFTDIHSPMGEAIRSLRTNLKYLFVDSELATLLVTSSIPREGRSTLATNLAVAWTQVGKKVLLMDADYNKPILHKAFANNNRYGLSNLLNKNCTIQNALQPSGNDKLMILTSGPGSHVLPDLLGSNRMKELLKEMKETFDLIIIDSPAVLSGSGAILLSTMVSGTLFVAERGRVTRQQITQAMGHLHNVKAKIVGVVLNKVPINKKSYYVASGNI